MKKWIAAFVCLLVSVSVISAEVIIANAEDEGEKLGDLTISGEGIVKDTHYSYDEAKRVLTILSNEKMTLSGNTTVDRIVVASPSGANLTLSGLTIEMAGDDAAFDIVDVFDEETSEMLTSKDTVIKITLKNANTLQSGKGYAGLQKSSDVCALVIEGDGSLFAEGRGGGAGIGGGSISDDNYNGNGTNITIRGSVTVTAISGEGGGAGIGGGYGGNAENINISSSNMITAEGGGAGRTPVETPGGGAGIGGGCHRSSGSLYVGGSGTNITISGKAVVKATGQAGGAGIGGGYGGSGDKIYISGESNSSVNDENTFENINWDIVAQCSNAYDYYGGAGIGGGYNGNGTNINISGSKMIYAAGKAGGAGIGGGYNGSGGSGNGDYIHIGGTITDSNGSTKTEDFDGTIKAVGSNGGSGGAAGIGGGGSGNGTNITISGNGTVNATGDGGGAGIGGGSNSNAKNITIGEEGKACGITITAEGSNAGITTGGAGIGGGGGNNNGGNAENITIYGCKKINAEGGTGGAGIGGGYRGNAKIIKIYGGEEINAKGGNDGAGIGGGGSGGKNGETIEISGGANVNAITGYSGDVNDIKNEDALPSANSGAGAGIGGGKGGSGVGIKIDNEGGTVIAKSYQGAGIGAGGDYDSDSDITIVNGNIIAISTQSGAGIGGGHGSFYSNGSIKVTIGSDESTIDASKLTIDARGFHGGAGIGGGISGSPNNKITIYNCKSIYAKGDPGDSGNSGAGIGGGNGSGGSSTITINNGKGITAIGGPGSAGIGGGYGGATVEININGGTITNAQGGNGGAGIGGGVYNSSVTVNISGDAKITAQGNGGGAGIGGGMGSDGSSIKISGGTVNASCESPDTYNNGYGAGIGGGSNGGSGSNIEISGNAVINAFGCPFGKTVNTGRGGAGIGGGNNMKDDGTFFKDGGGAGINIIISGSADVEATGGAGTSGGAGIGGGNGGNGTGITINVSDDGKVIAEGSAGGAGIGGGNGGSGGEIVQIAQADEISGITISGSGTVKATGNGGGAGIGGGARISGDDGSEDDGDGSKGGNGTNITISDSPKITAEGTGGGAGIGGGKYGDGTSITIDENFSGTVTAKGGGVGSGGAGIGGGKGGIGDKITISGSGTAGGDSYDITAEGYYGGAGIGGGDGGSGTNITINGSLKIKAEGYYGGAGIGGGDGGSGTNITINGSLKITAVGGGGSAGIGGGNGESGTSITISGSGGTINATGGGSGGAGIGGGANGNGGAEGDGNGIYISGNVKVTATGKGDGAGIGGGSGGDGENIQIGINAGDSVTIIATGNGAGIGGGNGKSGSDITIGNADGNVKVTATSESGGAGIGGGKGGAGIGITIEGDTTEIEATGNGGGAGIGGGSGGAGGTSTKPIKITGGNNIKATGSGANMSGGAGIGGGSNSSGNVEISGGKKIEAEGGSGGAGIGGGSDGNGTVVKISGDTYIEATGGQQGAGIGGGRGSNYGGKGTTVEINGIDDATKGCTKIKAEGGSGDGNGGAGIGGGSRDESTRITISGNTSINATGGQLGAGIGGGRSGSNTMVEINGIDDAVKGCTKIEATGGSGNGSGGAGIGGGSNNSGGKVVISGNTSINATGGQNGAGIGSGIGGRGVTVEINGINDATKGCTKIEAIGNGGGAGIGGSNSGVTIGGVLAVTSDGKDVDATCENLIGGTYINAIGGENGVGIGGSGVTINGGFVIAKSGSENGIGIGGASGSFVSIIGTDSTSYPWVFTNKITSYNGNSSYFGIVFDENHKKDYVADTPDEGESCNSDNPKKVYGADGVVYGNGRDVVLNREYALESGKVLRVQGGTKFEIPEAGEGKANMLTLEAGSILYIEKGADLDKYDKIAYEGEGNNKGKVLHEAKSVYEDVTDEAGKTKKLCTLCGSETNHTWNTDDWVYSKIHHWHECEKNTDCSIHEYKIDLCNITENKDKDGYGKHIFVKKDSVTRSNNTVTFECSVCGYSYEVTIPEISIYKVGRDGEDEDEYSLSGAKFGLYSDAACTELVGEEVTAAEVTVDDKTKAKAVFTADIDLNKTYYIKETKAPDGYKKSDKVYTVKVTAETDESDESDEPIEPPVEPPTIDGKVVYGVVGSTDTFEEIPVCENYAIEEIVSDPVKIIKEDGETNSPLAGAQFSVFSDEACKNPIAGMTGTTAIDADKASDTYNKAVVSFDTELNKTYYIKEIKAPNGYTASTEVYRAVVGADGKVTYSVVDPETTLAGIPVCENYAIEDVVSDPAMIIKEDGEGNPLAGAQFGIYRNENCTDLITTETTVIGADDKAAVSFTTESGKTYYIREIAAPEGYEVSDEVYKAVVDADGKVTYVTYGAAGSEKTSETAPVCKNYAVEVISDPIKIIKKDGETEAPLAGAWFGLYSDAECTDLIKTRTTVLGGADNQAVVSFTTEPNKTYYIKETVAPKGYEASDEVYRAVVGADGKVTYSVVDPETTLAGIPVCKNYAVEVIPDPVEIIPDPAKIIKMDGETNAPLTGARFGLYNDAECTNLITTGITKIDTDNASNTYNQAVVSFTTEPDTTYYIKEIATPEGYEVSDEVYKAVVDADGKVTYSVVGSETTLAGIPVCENYAVEVIPDPVEIIPDPAKIIKVDGETNAPLTGARFGIYSDAECTNLITTGITKIDTDNASATYNQAVVSFSTEPNRTYFIKETFAPDGYRVSHEVFKAVVDADGKVTYGVAGSATTSETVPVCKNEKTDEDDDISDLESDPEDTPQDKPLSPKTGDTAGSGIAEIAILSGIACAVSFVGGVQKRKRKTVMRKSC